MSGGGAKFAKIHLQLLSVLLFLSGFLVVFVFLVVRVPGSGFQVPGLPACAPARASAGRFRVPGYWLLVSGYWFQVRGLEFSAGGGSAYTETPEGGRNSPESFLD